MNRKLKILISGGGTGGHIFPAIAIANAIKEKQPDVEIQFVGALGRMEMEKVPLAGFPITGLWISGFQRKLTIRNLSFPAKVLSSIIKANRIITMFNPDIVIGTGGYASGPLLYVASKKKIPTLIHEQNAFPGVTNKLLAKSVTKVCVSYPEMEKYFPNEKIVITGNPIRKEIQNLTPTKKESLEFFNLKQTKKTLLIIGGSQGAQRINIAIAENIKKLLELGLQIIWQTGSSTYELAKESVGENKDVAIYEFIQKMDMAYTASDFIISRAGAIAIAEIIAAKKPAIYIPLPSAAEDHQTKNAMSLVDGEAGLIVTESEAIEKLPVVVKALVENHSLQESIIANLASFSYPNAAADIADEVLKLTKEK